MNYVGWGLLALFFWTLDYWKVFRKPELFYPPIQLRSQSIPRILIYLLGACGWVLISYSLSYPKDPLGYAPNTTEVNDIFVVVDVSRSMLAEDFKPNRFEAAKERLKEFVQLYPQDRIGLVIFSEQAFTLLPLTTDLKLVEQSIDQIKMGPLGSGTNIGDALGLAVARATTSQSKNKVIILLTDGVSNVGNISPLQAAEKAKEMKIKVYTIGMGSDKNAKIPLPHSVFGMRYQLIPGGSVDLETLQRISKMTGGRSYSAEDGKALKQVLQEIEKLERTKIDNNNQLIYKEKYYSYLLMGFLILFLAQFLRRKVQGDLL